MARPAEWIHRVNRILDALGALEAPTLDRQAIESLFEVSPRQALRILHRFAGHHAGQALLIGRLELKAKLEALAGGSDEGWRREQRRHQSVAEELRRIASDRNARRVRIAAAPAAVPVTSAALEQMSPGIRLGNGKLEISYSSGEELLGRLLELARAVADDPERFRQVTGSGKTL